MADSRRLDTPALTIDGQPLDASLYPRLRQVRVEESVQLPDRFTLRFDDPAFELFDAQTFTLGTSVQVAFRTESDPIVVTEGEVTSIAVEPGSARHHELVIVGLDRGHRLDRVVRTRTFQNMSDGAIARQIASEYGLDPDVDISGETIDYVMQADQTDWAFLRDRAARAGHDVWVTGTRLHVSAAPRGDGSPPVLRWRDNLHHFSVRFTAGDRCDEVIVNGWDGVGKKALRGNANTSQATSDAPAMARLGDAARHAFGRESRESGFRGVRTAAEADAMARSLLARTSGSQVVLRAEATGDPQLGAGSNVRIENVGEGLSGTYRITAVEHHYASGTAYTTRLVSGSKDPIALADLVGGASRRGVTPAGGSIGSALGLLVGEVTNNSDPDDLARVRVRFPTLSHDDESHWARMVSPGGGDARGIQWLPEQGDEVLVGFEFGDVHRPIVLGGLWSRTDQPPEPRSVTDGKVIKRVLATRKNHRLEMLDADQGKVSLRLGDAACELTLTKDETKLAGEQKLVLTADTIEISATKKLTLNGQQIAVSASGDVTMSGQPIKLN